MKHAIPQRYAIPHRYATRPGLYFTEDGGADVIVRSETADQVWLCIYEKVDQPTAFFNDAIRIFDDSATPFINEIHEHAVCTRIIEPMYVRETLFRMDGPNYGLWYVHLPKAWDGMRYAYRVDGAWDPSKGLRFNPYKLLLDPYGKGIDGRMKLSPAAFSYQCDVSEDGKVRGSAFGPMSTVDALGNMPVSVAIDDRDKTKHDADPSHPHVPWSKTVLYELHVKGFTANAPCCPRNCAARTRVSPTRPRSRTCNPWASPPSSCCPSRPSRMSCSCRSAGGTTTGGTRHSATSPPSLRTPLPKPSARGPGRSARGHRHGARAGMRPGSRSSWTWCTTTPAKAEWKGRRHAGAVWTRSCITGVRRQYRAA